MKTIQFKSDSMAGQSALKVEGTEGDCGTTDVPSKVGNLTQSKSLASDPEVIEKNQEDASLPPINSAS